MARRDKKREKGYYRTKYWLEWISEHTEDGEKVAGAFTDQPLMFRYLYVDAKSATKVQRQIIAGFKSTDVSVILETRYDIPFKINDLILDDLTILPDGRTAKNNQPFVNYAKINGLDERIDEDIDKNNLRGIDNARIKVLSIDA